MTAPDPPLAWGPQPILTDDIVTLTCVLNEDAPTMAEWDHDPEIARWFDFPPPSEGSEQVERVLGVIARWQQEYAAGVRITWAVRDAQTTRLLGSVELRPRADGGADASYTTHPAHRRQGIAARALRLACAWALDEGGFERVIVEHDARNVASEGVARAVGFVEIGRRPGGMTYEHGESPGEAVVMELRPD
jgi:RimJ/RimL family protein N-acetyltransferase